MTESPSFECRSCGKSFTVKPDVLARYPGWKPAICWPCKQKGQGGGKTSRPAARKSGSRAGAGSKRRPAKKAKEENLPLAKVLERYTGGPTEGVFTDGACSGNPGPGGWGVVVVRDDTAVDQRHGHDAHTTNNRMELQALIAAYELLPEDAETVIYSDSNLCVRTLNEWAAGWKRRGWKRKTGPVENLELVQRAYELSLRHPKVELRWIKAHAGSRWNEYADSLATAYMRDEL